MAQIPERLINFAVYGGTASNQLLGMATVELPKFEALAETISGAGIAGEYDSPVLGHFKAMSLKLKWRTLTADAVLLLAPVQHVLDIRESVQLQDPMLSAIATQAWRVEVRGQSKGLDPGKLEPGKPTDAECEIEVAKITISLAGVPLVELDKFNMSFKIAGRDYLQSVRADLGGV